MRTAILIALMLACVPAVADNTTSEHWAFQPIRRVTPPDSQNADWARNEIDRFIPRNLEAEGVRPSAEADRKRFETSLETKVLIKHWPRHYNPEALQYRLATQQPRRPTPGSRGDPNTNLTLAPDVGAGHYQ